MAHPNEQLARKLYDAFGKGDMAISGDHTKAGFPDFIGQVMQISGGTFREEIVDLLVSDDHVLAMLDHRFEKRGSEMQYFTSHLWTVRDGKMAEWRELPDDQDELSAAWSWTRPVSGAGCTRRAGR